MAAWSDLELEQLDVKTKFLHCLLEEQIYMHKPEGFSIEGKEGRVRVEEVFVWFEAVPTVMAFEV